MGMSKQTSKAPLKSPLGSENQASLLQHVAGIRIHLDEIRVHLAVTSTQVVLLGGNPPVFVEPFVL